MLFLFKGCGHCKAMKPAFAEAAAKLHEKKVCLYCFSEKYSDFVFSEK